MSGSRKMVIAELNKLREWAIEQRGTGFTQHRNHVHKLLEVAAETAMEFWETHDTDCVIGDKN